MIEDYLKKREARGQECAISMKALIFAFAAREPLKEWWLRREPPER